MRILSLGLGVQSTWLYYASVMGHYPRFDYAIFADPGREKTSTTKYLNEVLLPWAKANNGPEIIIENSKNLYEDLLNQSNSTGQRFASIPAFTASVDGGMLRRQCTSEYKIAPVTKAIRRLYGLDKHKRMPPTEIWMGITSDELSRMNNPLEVWKKNVYPMCGFWFTREDHGRLDYPRMSRSDVMAAYEKHGIPIPPKSSCVFCPYQSDLAWRNLKKEFPEDFAAAVAVDKAIRDSSKKGVKSKIYLHSSMKPLDQVDFNENQTDLWHGNCASECHI